ncbi:immunoglobulin-like domain-containing protein [Aquimarina sp. 2201CG5-10]|uniref:immunoglobulin-like domain-containing protein n=1 Tax=Aquimarina callyspongiae TaxID=3098150 RepID=UPI002AB4B751|nr:immunoglobulin-like domain-containing protein [Aquimarina sp. 2201CG5-10]MDY8135525.1 DUF5011 domain-containing protein [Aquimarina sp. 2201CG5-10]
MHKSFKYIIGGLISITLILACTKEITEDLLTFFSVEVEGGITQEAFLNIPKSTEITVDAAGTIEAGNYEIKYNVTQGTGSYRVGSEIIPQNEYVVFPTLPLSIDYIGSTVGIHKVLITIKDDFDRERDVEITYTVNDTDFSFTVMPVPESAYVGQRIDLNMNITEITASTYQTSYVITNLDIDGAGTGNILIDGQSIDPEISQDTQAGDFIWQFEAISLGTVELAFTTISELGVTVITNLQIEITETPDFTFSAQSSVIQASTNNPVDINFDLTETVGTSTYIMTFTSSNTGSVTYDGSTYQEGEDIPFTTGQSAGTYTGTAAGTHEIEFTVSNANQTPIVKNASVTVTYSDPDTEIPVITLLGDNPLTINLNESYVEPGFTVQDNIDTDLESQVTVTGTVDTSVAGSYQLSYNVTDSSDNAAETQVRIVNVVDNIAPVITLNGLNPTVVFVGAAYEELATATDNVDGDITTQIQFGGTFSNTNTIGTYTRTYNVSDAAGNNAVEQSRTIIVQEQDTAAPIITLNGDNPQIVQLGETYTEAGATATDDVDGDVTDNIQISGTVSTNTAGEYTVTYTVADTAGNQQSVTRTVIVNDPPVAVIVASPLSGVAPLTVSLNNAQSTDSDGTIERSTWSFDGANNNTGGFPHNISRTYDTPGTYTIGVRVFDNYDGEGYVEVQINVTSPDATPPVITLNGDNPQVVQLGETYAEAGATATDDVDGDLTSSISISGNVDTNTAGQYTITYSVTDAAGNTDTETRTVIVNDPPNALIRTDVTGGVAPLTVSFGNGQSTDSDGNIVTSVWSFGDGTSGNSGGFPLAVSHTFDAPGFYTVTLELYDNNSGVGTSSVVIAVEQGTCDCPPGEQPCEPFPICNCIDPTTEGCN